MVYVVIDYDDDFHRIIATFRDQYIWCEHGRIEGGTPLILM